MMRPFVQPPNAPTRAQTSESRRLPARKSRSASANCQRPGQPRVVCFEASDLFHHCDSVFQAQIRASPLRAAASGFPQNDSRNSGAGAAKSRSPSSSVTNRPSNGSTTFTSSPVRHVDFGDFLRRVAEVLGQTQQTLDAVAAFGKRVRRAHAGQDRNSNRSLAGGRITPSSSMSATRAEPSVTNATGVRSVIFTTSRFGHSARHRAP